MRRAVNWLDYSLRLPLLSSIQSPLNCLSHKCTLSRINRAFFCDFIYWNLQRVHCASSATDAACCCWNIFYACIATNQYNTHEQYEGRHKLRLIQECQQILFGPRAQQEDRRAHFERRPVNEQWGGDDASDVATVFPTNASSKASSAIRKNIAVINSSKLSCCWES